jgi:hypothetical protein
MRRDTMLKIHWNVTEEMTLGLINAVRSSRLAETHQCLAKAPLAFAH